MKPLLIIQFAKWPISGRVKTRLAAALGDQVAKQVHIELMNSVCMNMTSFASADYELWLDEFYDDQLACLGDVGEKLRHQEITYQLQCHGGLGTKMAHAFERSLSQYQKVIVVGSDCPTVDSVYLRQAAELLDSHDAVLGPAEDGGYVLIGVNNSFKPEIFSAVKWGSDRVLIKTRENIKALGLSCGLLDTTWDVDELADYQRWLHC